METKKRTRCVAYIRVSTGKQAEHGLSLEAQEAKLRAYAELFELDLVATEVDAGESASSLDRPGLQRALARLDAFEASAILVVKLDRLTRSVRDLCVLVDSYFRDNTYSLLSVGEQIDTRSAAGRLVMSILVTVSQWEREAIGERTSAVMQHMKATGKFTGGHPPYGFRLDLEGNLIKDADEEAVLYKARALRVQGASLRVIAKELGVNKRNGKPFNPEQIARMVDRDEALQPS